MKNTVCFLLLFIVGCDNITPTLIREGANCYDSHTETGDQYILRLNKPCVDRVVSVATHSPQPPIQPPLKPLPVDPIAPTLTVNRLVQRVLAYHALKGKAFTLKAFTVTNTGITTQPNHWFSGGQDWAILASTHHRVKLVLWQTAFVFHTGNTYKNVTINIIDIFWTQDGVQEVWMTH